MALSKHLKDIKEAAGERQLREELRVALWKIKDFGGKARADEYANFPKLIRELRDEVVYAMEVYNAATWPERADDGVERITV